MIFDQKNARAHSPFRAIEVGATNPEASETRHRATITTNALKAMVKDVEFGREERREGSVNRLDFEVDQAQHRPGGGRCRIEYPWFM